MPGQGSSVHGSTRHHSLAIYLLRFRRVRRLLQRRVRTQNAPSHRRTIPPRRARVTERSDASPTISTTRTPGGVHLLRSVPLPPRGLPAVVRDVDVVGFVSGTDVRAGAGFRSGAAVRKQAWSLASGHPHPRPLSRERERGVGFGGWLHGIRPSLPRSR